MGVDPAYGGAGHPKNVVDGIQTAIVQARRFSASGHIARMPDETDAKKILTASPSENCRRPPGCPRIT